MVDQKSSAQTDKKLVSSFIRREIICPLCGVDSEQLQIKARLYNERDRDVDGRPQKIECTVKGVDEKHPALYYVWVCPHCSYAAGSANFLDPLKNTRVTLSHFKKNISFIGQDYKARNVVAILTVPVQNDNLSFLDAVRRHLLAIYELELIEDIVKRESLNLGKYYLRLAWLFKDVSEKSDQYQKFSADYKKLLDDLSPFWDNIVKNDTEALERALTYYNIALTNSSVIETARDEVELILLMARVTMKLGDIKGAKRLLQSSKEKSRKFDEVRNSRFKTTDVEWTPQEKTEMNADARRMRLSIDEVERVYEILVD